jgi:hypothetical protein
MRTTPPSVPPHRSEPSTARTVRPPMSGGGGGVDGDDFGVWATNAPPPLRPPENDEDDPTGMPPVPHTDPTPRPRAPPVHLRVAAVAAATATTLVRGRRTHIHHSGPLKTTRTTPLACHPFPTPTRPLDCARRPSTYEWRRWRRQWQRLWYVGDKRASTTQAPRRMH